jgi:hypothetical protein
MSHPPRVGVTEPRSVSWPQLWADHIAIEARSHILWHRTGFWTYMCALQSSTNHPQIKLSGIARTTRSSTCNASFNDVGFIPQASTPLQAQWANNTPHGRDWQECLLVFSRSMSMHNPCIVSNHGPGLSSENPGSLVHSATQQQTITVPHRSGLEALPEAGTNMSS